MKYELAKKLKEAGFPQETDYYFDSQGVSGNGGEMIFDIVYKNKLPEKEYFRYAIPTLSELIEACGDDFRDLIRYKANDTVMWCVHGHNSQWTGFNPIEAIASLYISLHGNAS